MQKINSEGAPDGTGLLTRNRQAHNFCNNLQKLQNKAKMYKVLG